MPHDRFAARLRSAQIYSQIWGRQVYRGEREQVLYDSRGSRVVLNGSPDNTSVSNELVPATYTAQPLYVSLVVLYCWSSVVIHSLHFRRNEARRRFAGLVCDCILDLVSCVGVPLIIVFSYVNMYDPELTGFDMEKW
ncbi:hypothetical protein GQ600_7761 [Phytophthora cactorum]|nr:hypothetical protein GQ600_7761 [Phytophthora cactorum]